MDAALTSAGAGRGARAHRGTEAGRRGLAAGAARRRQLDPAQARGHGRPDPGRTPATRTCSTSPAISSPATASRPGCSPSTSAPPTGGSSTTSTACSRPPAFADPVRLPGETLILDRYGLARELSLPIDARRLAQRAGLELPARQRRAAQPRQRPPHHPGRLPRRRGRPARSPPTSSRVPLAAYLRLLQEALRPPAELLRLPFTANWPEPVETMVSLLLRPLVCPAVPEGLAGEAHGDPLLRARRAGLQPRLRREHLRQRRRPLPARATTPALDVGRLDRPQRLRHPRAAPHPAAQEGRRPAAREPRPPRRERAAGMCWADESELYNDGRPFKITSRGIDGVMVTILADNYFGYCKKEVKTQIGYSANLFGLAEEEHAGGALAFATFSLGDRFVPDLVRIVSANHRFAEVLALLGERAKFHAVGLRHRRDLSRDPLHAGGHGDRRPPPGHHLDQRGPGAAPQAPARPDLHPPERLQGPHGQAPRGAELAADRARCPRAPSATSRAPSRAAASRRSARAWSTRCCPGRSTCAASRRTWRWSRRSSTATTTTRACPTCAARARPAPILSPERSLGSVIKLLTPTPAEFTPEYNAWLESIPNHVRALVFVIKRFYRPEWGDDWREPLQRRHHQRRARARAQVRGPPAGRQLSADRPRGERRLADVQAAAGLRRGRQGADGGRHHRLGGGAGAPAGRPARASTTATPASSWPQNCEFRLFQRPDDAIHPGLDRQTEEDMAGPGLFCSNFEPLTRDDARRIVEDVAVHDAFTPPMREHVARNAARADGGYSICSAQPRLVDGKPTKNPRYLQVRPDLAQPARPLRRGDGRPAQPPAAAARAGAVPGDQRALGPAEQPARGRASARSASTDPSTTRSCPSCSWTTSAR